MRSSRELFRKSNNQAPKSNDPSIGLTYNTLTIQDQNKGNGLNSFNGLIDTPEPEQFVPIAAAEARKGSLAEVMDGGVPK